MGCGVPEAACGPEETRRNKSKNMHSFHKCPPGPCRPRANCPRGITSGQPRRDEGEGTRRRGARGAHCIAVAPRAERQAQAEPWTHLAAEGWCGRATEEKGQDGGPFKILPNPGRAAFPFPKATVDPYWSRELTCREGLRRIYLGASGP